METYSTRHAAKKLGITAAALSKYIKAKKVPAPKIVKVGRLNVHIWTDSEIEQVRQLLPKIANGRKTRHQKKGKKKQNSKQSKR
jgi:predicted transcriptional regulator